MNKKEQAAFEELMTRLALRFTDEDCCADIPPPSAGRPLSKGFLFNRHYMSVSKACSSHNAHNPVSDEKILQQGERWLYSSKLRALKAMRQEMEFEFARLLRAVDKKIELCLKDE